MGCARCRARRAWTASRAEYSSDYQPSTMVRELRDGAISRQARRRRSREMMHDGRPSGRHLPSTSPSSVSEDSSTPNAPGTALPSQQASAVVAIVAVPVVPATADRPTEGTGRTPVDPIDVGTGEALRMASVSAVHMDGADDSSGPWRSPRSGPAATLGARVIRRHSPGRRGCRVLREQSAVTHDRFGDAGGLECGGEEHLVGG